MGSDMREEVKQLLNDLDANWSEFSSLLSAAQNLVKVLEPTMVAKLTDMINAGEEQAALLRDAISQGLYLHPHSRVGKALSGIFSAGRELSALRSQLFSYTDALKTISGTTIQLQELPKVCC